MNNYSNTQILALYNRINKVVKYPHLYLALLLSLLLSIGGCSNILSASTDEPITQDPGQRTWGAALDDQEIETIAKVNLSKADPQLEQANVHVTSYNGVVLLSGQVSSNKLRQLAGNTVNQLRRVRQVHNELQVSGTTSLLSRSNDSWLTGKVKTRLLSNSELEGGRIKVVSENGTVYLMGLLTRSEAQLAAEIARTTGGVQQVVKAIEYID